MKKIALLICLLLLFVCRLNAQICGTPGLDGPQNISVSINTYFPVPESTVMPSGTRQIMLAAVPPNDPYGNNFGLKPISAGDLVLIIQMQDATIDYFNNTAYGSGNGTSGPDLLGGTGYTSLGNTGIYEYVIATSAVPLSGGLLSFRAFGAGNGTVSAYYNLPANTTRGRRTFQVVRVPQYSNLILSNNISTPPFNGKVGGIIAFDVAGTMEFNGFKVDASARGFRGGYGPKAFSDEHSLSDLYVTPFSDSRSTGKGEGIAGTPWFMWDGFNEVNNLEEGLPGGSSGRGAPGNAGGGGNDHNSGGGGGGNGGAGGVGGNGFSFGPAYDGYPSGGRPGINVYSLASPNLGRLIMGGGGGGGDANNSQNGVKGGVGGGIVLINAKSIKGVGTILSNGGSGEVGLFGTNPDGAGGGGAGGTVFIKVTNTDPTALLTIEAKGGKGGNTERDQAGAHGPGGGGGGGQIVFNMQSSAVILNVNKGAAGMSAGLSNHGSAAGQDGNTVPFVTSDLPPYLQGAGAGCYPELNTLMYQNNGTALNFPGSIVTYIIKITNVAGGNAGGVQADVQLPVGFSYVSATAVYTGGSGGSSVISNFGDAGRPVLGDFNIAPSADVTITLKARIDCSVAAAVYNASVQALYFDPSRTLADPNRRITAAVNASAGAKTTYESGSVAALPVPGSNYNGTVAVAEDILVLASIPVGNNILTAPLNSMFCLDEDPDVIIGSLPTGVDPDNYVYQWQESADDVNFTDIPGAVFKDFDPPKITATVYYRRVVVNLGCMTDVSASVMLKLAVEVVFDPIPSVCVSADSFVLTQARSRWNEVPGEGTYSGAGITDGGTFNPALVGPGTYPITYTFRAETGCTHSKTENIVVLPLPIVDAGPDQIIMEGGQVKLAAVASAIASLTYQWTPATDLDRTDVLNPIASPTKDMVYKLTVVSSNGSCESTDEVRVKVLKKLEIPNAFSPNGDGINDEWEIKYVSSYPNSKIEVFNRYGEKVFSSVGGKLSWDGKYAGNAVPVGTYYYVLNPGNGRKIITGSVTVIR